MRTLFLLTLLACGAISSAATYTVLDVTEFQTAWNAAVPGDVISLENDVDFAQISVALADKTGSISVQSAGGALIWGAASGQTSLPQGMTLSNIEVMNAPGTLSAAGVEFGKNVSFIQSQGSASLMVIDGNTVVRQGNSFEHIVSATDGGVVLVKQGGVLLVEGGVSFESCASEGVGGAICVEDQQSASAYALVLKADTAKGDITFTGNQSEAVPEKGLYTGFANDIYLGENAAMQLDAADGARISLSGGVESADVSARIDKTGSGDLILGEGAYYAGSLVVKDGSVSLVEDATWGDGSANLQVNQGSSFTLEDGSAVDGTVNLGGKLVAAGLASVSGELQVQSDAAVLDVADSLSLNGGLAGAAGTKISKTGAGTLLLADSADYAGALQVQTGTLALADRVTLGKQNASLSMAAGSSLVLNNGSAVQAALAMQAASLQVYGPAALKSSISLTGANTWTFHMTDTAVQSTTHRLQLSPTASITMADGASLTLNVDMSGVTSTGSAEKIYLVDTTALSDSETKETLGKAEVTLTDKNGTRETLAVLDTTTGTIDLASLIAENAPEVYFDRPGVSVANALHSSVGALHAFASQSLQHLSDSTSAKGMNIWCAGLGYFDNYSSSWRYSGGGYAVGVSGSLGSDTMVGVAFGQVLGSNSADFNTTESDAEAEIEQDEIMLAVQLRHAFESTGGGTPVLDIVGGVGLTTNDFKSSAHSGSWDDTNLYASARLSWHWKGADGVFYAPYIGLEYVSGVQDSATLSGPAGSWSSNGADMNILTLPVGVNLYTHFDVQDGMIFTPSLGLGYRVDLLEADPSTTCSDGTAIWKSAGEQRSRGAFNLDVSFHLQITSQWSAWGSWHVETRSGQDSNTLSAGVNYTF